MKKNLAVALAVVGALGLVFALQRANSARMQALEHEIHRLSGAPAAVIPPAAAPLAEHVPVIVTTVAVAPKPAPPAASAGPGEPESTDSPSPAPPSDEDQVAFADSVYSQQRFDPSWARPAQAALSSALAKRLGSSTLQSLDCRESLCKAELSHRDSAGFTAFLDRLVGNANELWKGPIASYRNAEAGRDGSVQSSVYFGKEGTDIPRL